MKVEIITLHAINNYGSAFQALATEQCFISLGCEVETIDYIRANARSGSLLDIFKTKGTDFTTKMKRLFLRILRPNQRTLVLAEFRKRCLHLTPLTYYTDGALYRDVPVADIYCTGSDQTWNIECQGEVPLPFFLDFAPKGKKRISFSASFGIDDIMEKYKVQVSDLLSKYDSISVREKSGVDIIKGLGLKSTQTLDPTLAIGFDFWNSLASGRLYDGDYVLVYQLNSNRKLTEYVREYARRNNLFIVYIRSRKDTIWGNGVTLTEPRPEDLLSLFKYAKCVITDSFHATAFSILFHRNFICVYPDKYSSRIESILNLTGLQRCQLKDFGTFPSIEEKINYEEVDSILARERKVTFDFLTKAIQ